MRFLLLFVALVALSEASEVEKLVYQIIQGYGNPKNVGRQRTGSIIVNNVHHLKPEWRGNLFHLKAKYLRDHGAELLVAADQEGGKVSRLRSLFPSFKFYSPAEMGAMTDAEVFEHAKAIGTMMFQAGVNMNLAPPLDACDPGTLMAKQGRCFGASTDLVTLKGQAYVNGILDTFPEAALVAKHFPGYNERRNSDVTPVFSKETREEVMARARPFFDVQGLAGVMMSSIRYEAFGGEVAVFCKEMIDQIRAARPDLIVMTDDLVAPSLVPAELQGEARHAAIGEVALKAFRAGNDLLLAMDGRAMNAIVRTISRAVEAEPALRRQLDETVARLQKLRTKLAGRPSSMPAPLLSNSEIGAVNSAEQCIRDSERVSEVQRVLIERNHLDGAADGKWGPLSQAALDKNERAANRAVSRCLTEEKMKLLITTSPL